MLRAVGKILFLAFTHAIPGCSKHYVLAELCSVVVDNHFNISVIMLDPEAKDVDRRSRHQHENLSQQGEGLCH